MQNLEDLDSMDLDMGRVQEPPPPQEDLLDYDDELAEEVDPYPDDTLVTQSVPVAVVTRIPKVGPVGEQARDRDEILPLPPLVQPRYRLPPPPPPAPIWAPLCVIAASDALKEKIQALLVEEQGIYKGLQRVRSGFASAVECLTPWAQQLVENGVAFSTLGEEALYAGLPQQSWDSTVQDFRRQLASKQGVSLGPSFAEGVTVSSTAGVRAGSFRAPPMTPSRNVARSTTVVAGTGVRQGIGSETAALRAQTLATMGPPNQPRVSQGSTSESSGTSLHSAAHTVEIRNRTEPTRASTRPPNGAVRVGGRENASLASQVGFSPTEPIVPAFSAGLNNVMRTVRVQEGFTDPFLREQGNRGPSENEPRRRHHEESSEDEHNTRRVKVSLLSKHFSMAERLWLMPVREASAAEYGPLVVASALPKYYGDFSDTITIVAWIKTVSQLFFSVAGVPVGRAVSIMAQCFPPASPAEFFFSGYTLSNPYATFGDVAEKLVEEYMSAHMCEQFSAELHALKQGSLSVSNFVMEHAKLWVKVHTSTTNQQLKLLDFSHRLNKENTKEFLKWETRMRRSNTAMTLPSLLTHLSQKERESTSGSSVPGRQTVFAVTDTSPQQKRNFPQKSQGQKSQGQQGNNRDNRDTRDNNDRGGNNGGPKRSFDLPNCRRCGFRGGHKADGDCSASKIECNRCKLTGHYSTSPMCHLFGGPGGNRSNNNNGRRPRQD